MRKCNNKQNKCIHIRKTALISAALSVCLLAQAAAGVQWSGLRNTEAEAKETVTTTYIKNKENLAVVTNSPEDKRTPFTILEVIPHKACSVFPYMVEWGDKESYDRNVPIGYDGVVQMANMYTQIQVSSPEGVAASQSRFYTYIPRGIKRETLSVADGGYNVDFALSETDQSGKWSRVYETDKDEDRTESGYFERVQTGKGLYSLSKPVTGVETPGMGRGTSDLKEGTFWGYVLADYAQDFIKTLPKEWENPTAGTESPIYYGTTEANYTLAFDRSTGSGASDAYMYNVKEAKPNKAGNYALDASYTANVAEGKYGVGTAEEAEKGLYVRVISTTQDDGYINDELALPQGYFRLYDAAQDNGKTRYNVQFIVSTTGKYKEQFKYIGKGKGNFDVWFEPAADKKGTYTAKKLEVELGKGDYVALTSITQDSWLAAPELPQYTEQENGDYNLIISSITSKATTQDNSKSWDWVWVSVDDKSKMKSTLYNDYEEKKDTVGTRVYLEKYTRTYAYYTKYGFKNNEWFKLRCLFSDPSDSTKPYPYNPNKTAIENIESASSLLNSWDANNRIEIISVRPEQVTSDMVRKADLIYFADKPALEGIKGAWSKLTGDNSITAATDFKYTTDISFDIALQIYNKCIVNQEAALMTNAFIRDEYDKSSRFINRNTSKLYFMINFFKSGKTTFTEFLASSANYNDDFSRVDNDGSVVVTHAPDWLWHDQYYNPHTLFEGRETTSFRTGTWYPEYFMVFIVNRTSWGIEVGSMDPAYAYDEEMGSLLGKPSDTYLAFEWDAANFFKNFDNINKIWTILNNRNTPITLDITNAALTGSGELVIYADELDEEFPVNYIVNADRAGNATVEIKFADAKDSNLIAATGAPYNVEQSVNVRRGFTNPYWSNDKNTPLDSKIRKRKVVITAESDSGSTAQAEVWVIVRDMFDLN